MAKKKASKAKGAKKMGRPRLPERVKSSSRYGFRATADWMNWLLRYANFCRLDMVETIDRALERDAAKEGFEKPPKR